MSDDKQKLRDKLREQAPEMAAFVDDMRAVFDGDIKVTYLRVGDTTIGKPPEAGYEVDISNRVGADADGSVRGRRGRR